MIPSGRHVGEGTHQRVPSPTFRVMTPTVVGKTGAAYLRLPQTTGSSPLAWGTIATGTDTRVIPTVVGKIVGVVAGEGHGFDGSTPLLGLGCLAAEKFGGVQVFGGRTRTAPKPPPARKPLPQPLRGQGETVQVRAAELQPGPGCEFMAEKQQSSRPSMIGVNVSAPTATNDRRLL